jgi:thioredoxin-like negative regulator of GroEL
VLERILVLAAAALIFLVLVLLIRGWAGRRLGGLQAANPQPLWSALGESPDGRPSLVVFSTPSCAACRTAQHPAVDAVAARFGGALRVVRVDLSARPAVGEAFKVLTAPTTVVLAGDGRVGSINHGFASADQLSAQLRALGVSRVSPR